VTIRLTGPTQSGFATLPKSFTFKIVATTGKYSGDTDSGTATFTEAVADPVPPKSPSGPGVIVGPIFSLTLHSS
jgi:hypothetical protein